MSYAILQTGGKQYRVSKGDKIQVEKLDLSVGDEATLEPVLFYSDGSNAQVGSPHLSGASIKVKVLDQFKDKKVTAFKYRRRKGYHKSKGHRRALTRLEVQDIVV